MAFIGQCNALAIWGSWLQTSQDRYATGLIIHSACSLWSQSVA